MNILIFILCIFLVPVAAFLIVTILNIAKYKNQPEELVLVIADENLQVEKGKAVTLSLSLRIHALITTGMLLELRFKIKEYFA